MFKNFPYQINKIKKINKGLTNDNYLISLDNNEYMLRYPKNDTKDLFIRENEKIIINKLKNKDFILNTLYYEDGVQIVKYEHNLLNFNEYNNDDKIYKTAKLMQKLHNSNVEVKHDFDIMKQISMYQKYVDNSKINIDDYQVLFDKLNNYKYKKVLCHNDWVAGNICFIDDKTYLIDFEYAANNDPYFDIMSFITENDLTFNQKQQFLSYMFKEIDEKTEEILMMYRDLNNVLWYFWALMMYKFRNEEIYKEISEIKYKQFISEYNQKIDYIKKTESLL